MAVDKNLDQSQELLKKADQLRLGGSYDQAKIILETLIKQNPFLAPAKLGLGRVYFESGDLANARAVLEEFSEFVPDHSLANKILAKIYIHFNQFPKAKNKIDMVLSVSPEDSMAKRMLAEIEEADSFQEQDLTNEDTKKNSAPVNTATIAEIYRSQGHLKEALEIYKDLLRESPDHPSYQKNVQDLEAQLAPAKPAIIEHKESSVPEFRRVEVTDERAIPPMEKSGKTRQEKLERMLYLVQQHRKGASNV